MRSHGAQSVRERTGAGMGGNQSRLSARRSSRPVGYGFGKKALSDKVWSRRASVCGGWKICTDGREKMEGRALALGVAANSSCTAEARCSSPGSWWRAKDSLGFAGRGPGARLMLPQRPKRQSYTVCACHPAPCPQRASRPTAEPLLAETKAMCQASRVGIRWGYFDFLRRCRSHSARRSATVAAGAGRGRGSLRMC